MIEGKTPMEAWSGSVATDYDLLQIVGCSAYYHVSDGKLNPSKKKLSFWGSEDVSRTTSCENL